MTVAPDGTVEFSRPLRLDRLLGGDVEAAYTATAAENEALAGRFDLVAVHTLSGSLVVRRPANGPLVRVEGRIDARITQTCVVSLEPVTNRVTEAFVQLYTLGEAGDESEVFASPDDEEAPEPLTGGTLDLGEVLAEQLALAMDPYPRAPGARFDGFQVGAPADDEHPFAVLDQLRRTS